MSYVAALHVYRIQLGAKLIRCLSPLWLGQGRSCYKGGGGGLHNPCCRAPGEVLHGAWYSVGGGQFGLKKMPCAHPVHYLALPNPNSPNEDSIGTELVAKGPCTMHPVHPALHRLLLRDPREGGGVGTRPR